MKKKVIGLTLAGLLAIGSIVSAASMWGTYKGYDIIRIAIDGAPIKPSDTPAVSMDGRTMIPIYLLKEAGVEYAWDQKTKTVDIEKNSASATYNSASSINPTSVTKEIIALGGDGVSIGIVTGDTTATTYFNAKNGFDGDWDALFQIFVYLTKFESTFSRVVYVQNNENNLIEIKTQHLKSYLNGKITGDELTNHWDTIGPLFNNNQQVNSGNNGTGSYISSSHPELYSNDGKTFLGTLMSNKFDSDSVYNEFGTYGSKFSKDSIWNEFGTYGSEFSNQSAFNKFATEPPIIVQDGEIIGYLSVNTTLSNRVSPYQLLSWLEDNGY